MNISKVLSKKIRTCHLKVLCKRIAHFSEGLFDWFKYWSHNPRLELRQSDYWSWIAMIIKSRNFMSDAWFSMGWAAQVSEKVFHQNLRIGWTCCWHGALPSPHYQIFSPASTSLHHFAIFYQISEVVSSAFLFRFGNMQEISDFKATWWNRRSYDNCKCLLLLTTHNATRCVWKFSPRYEIWFYKSMDSLPS